MASAALTKFDGFVDGTSLSPTAKDRLKRIGKQLYREALREEYLHIESHIAAALADGDIDQQKADALRGVLIRGSGDDGHVPTEIVA